MMLILLILIVTGIIVAIVIGYVYQLEFSSKPLPAEQVQNIFSSDRNLQAVIRGRLDGTFQVEVRRRKVEEMDSGPSETWTLVYGPAIVASMEEAVDVANGQLGLLDADYTE